MIHIKSPSPSPNLPVPHTGHQISHIQRKTHILADFCSLFGRKLLNTTQIFVAESEGLYFQHLGNCANLPIP